jgi:hypothetical protein
MPISIDLQSDLILIGVSAPITSDDFISYTNKFSSILASNSNLYILIDLTSLNDVPFHFIINQSQFMKKIHQHVKQNVVASTVVISNSKILNLLEILFTFRKPVSPNLITRNHVEAIAFLTKYKNSNSNSNSSSSNSNSNDDFNDLDEIYDDSDDSPVALDL